MNPKCFILSVLKPSCILESPKEFCKNTMHHPLSPTNFDSIGLKWKTRVISFSKLH